MFSKCPKRGKTIDGRTNDNHELGFECFGAKVISTGKGRTYRTLSTSIYLSIRLYGVLKPPDSLKA